MAKPDAPCGGLNRSLRAHAYYGTTGAAEPPTTGPAPAREQGVGNPCADTFPTGVLDDKCVA